MEKELTGGTRREISRNLVRNLERARHVQLSAVEASGSDHVLRRLAGRSQPAKRGGHELDRFSGNESAPACLAAVQQREVAGPRIPREGNQLPARAAAGRIRIHFAAAGIQENQKRLFRLVRPIGRRTVVRRIQASRCGTCAGKPYPGQWSSATGAEIGEGNSTRRREQAGDTAAVGNQLDDR